MLSSLAIGPRLSRFNATQRAKVATQEQACSITQTVSPNSWGGVQPKGSKNIVFCFCFLFLEKLWRTHKSNMAQERPDTSLDPSSLSPWCSPKGTWHLLPHLQTLGLSPHPKARGRKRSHLLSLPVAHRYVKEEGRWPATKEPGHTQGRAGSASNNPSQPHHRGTAGFGEFAEASPWAGIPCLMFQGSRWDFEFPCW